MLSELPPAAAATFTVKVQRQDSRDSAAYFETFTVARAPAQNIISVLLAIAEKSTNSEGKKTTPVVWDCNCLEEVCGSCTMVINGRVRQSCSAMVADILKDPEAQNTITLQPMSKFPVVRDLWVDRSRMFENLKRLQAWVPIDGIHNLGAGPKETPDHQTERYDISRCMTCGCCLEACPQFTKDNAFVGAQAIAQAMYFNSHPTGATLKADRLDVLMAEGGVSDCGNAQNCVKVCPKEIPLTEAIAKAGRQLTVHAVKKMFEMK